MLRSAAPPSSAHSDDRLATGDQTGRRAAQFGDAGGEFAAQLVGFAREFAAPLDDEIHAARFLRGGIEGSPVAADNQVANAGKRRIVASGCLGDLARDASLEMVADALGRAAPYSTPLEDGDRVGESRRVGRGGSRADGGDVIAGDIGNNQ